MSHQRLKEETKSLHRELDQSEIMRKIMTAAVSFDDYLLFLQLHHSVYSSLEKDLPVIYADLGWQYEGRLTQLTSDIANLCQNRALKSFSRPIVKTSSIDLCNCLGTVYVLEGARHGNRFILEHLEKKLGISSTESTFLRHNSAITWNDVKRKIDALRPNELMMHINAAKSIFSLYIDSVKKLNVLKDEKHTI